MEGDIPFPCLLVSVQTTQLELTFFPVFFLCFKAISHCYKQANQTEDSDK